MNASPKVDSPFLQAEPLRVKFSTIMMLLLMVVGAGGGVLIYYALQVPAITSELNAWMGRTNPVSDTASGRSAHMHFLLVMYAAPLALGLCVYILQFGIAWLDARARSQDNSSDDEFRME